MPPIIEVTDLTKEFSRPDVRPGRFAGTRSLFTRAHKVTTAVDGISFQINGGELIGLLGPNGAGKSTTIKMLTGILVPTSGSVKVAGQVPWRERRRNARAIGAVFGQRTQLWYDLPLRDSFEIIRDLYSMDPSTYRTRLGDFTELLDLDEFIDTPVRSLSLGQRMRGDLVAAMLYAPPILYLDEPTVGLDVMAFIAYLPATVLLGRTDQLPIPAWLAAISPCGGLIVFTIGLTFFNRMIRKYNSPGS